MVEVPMISIACWCGMPFSMPQRLYDTRRADKETFYCPLGHHNVFRESETDRLRRERDRLTQRLAEKDDDIKRQRESREAAERSAIALRGTVTKLKKRAKAGVCPCCNRTFENLARHMATKHADMDPADTGENFTGNTS